MALVSNRTVSSYETGRSMPDRDTVNRLDEALAAGGALRVARLESLTGTTLSFVLNEEAVRKVVGTRAIHQAQVKSICELIRSRRIRLSVIPLFAPNHPSPGGTFRIFKLRGGRVVGHEEHRSGVHVVTTSAAHELGTVFGNLPAESLPTGQTEELLTTIEGESDG